MLTITIARLEWELKMNDIKIITLHSPLIDLYDETAYKSKNYPLRTCIKHA